MFVLRPYLKVMLKLKPKQNIQCYKGAWSAIQYDNGQQLTKACMLGVMERTLIISDFI